MTIEQIWKMKKRTKELKKVDLETILLGAKISNVMHAHIINIFDELDDNQVFGRQEVMEITGCGKTQASKILNVMKMNNVIVDVKGKGKYVFKVEERVEKWDCQTRKDRVKSS